MTQANVAILRRYHELLNETGEAPLAVVVRFRDGRIIRFEGYRERDEAAAAAGIAA